jgi:hypothetical protein
LDAAKVSGSNLELNAMQPDTQPPAKAPDPDEGRQTGTPDSASHPFGQGETPHTITQDEQVRQSAHKPDDRTPVDPGKPH